jgi:hypothetical protein
MPGEIADNALYNGRKPGKGAAVSFFGIYLLYRSKFS